MSATVRKPLPAGLLVTDRWFKKSHLRRRTEELSDSDYLVVRNMNKFLIAASSLLLVLMLDAQTVTGDQYITASEARAYMGNRATVCGQVASANFAAESRGKPTYLYLDRPYPKQTFTAVIWGENRDKFPETLEQAYRGKRLCVTGTISASRGLPQIIVADPHQISAEK